MRRAREEAQRAEAERQRVGEQWGFVNEVSAEIRKALRRNHFGEQIEAAAASRRRTR